MTDWLTRLADLLRRRPELAGVGISGLLVERVRANV